MPEMWKRQPKEVYLSWYEAIMEEASDKLTSWETNFMDSIALTIARETISEKQANILEKLYAEKTK